MKWLIDQWEIRRARKAAQSGRYVVDRASATGDFVRYLVKVSGEKPAVFERFEAEPARSQGSPILERTGCPHGRSA
jgi:hypothetical protein